MKQIAKAIIDQIVEELYSQRIFTNLTRPLYVEKTGGMSNSKTHVRIEVK